MKRAQLIWDGGPTLTIPKELGTPRADQMQGTVLEQLVELAGRTCYDSLGKGRPSFGDNGYHEHIKKADHGSVLAHANMTIHLQKPFADVCAVLANFPGVFVRPLFGGTRLTFNARVVRDWYKIVSRARCDIASVNPVVERYVHDEVRYTVATRMPGVFGDWEVPTTGKYVMPVELSHDEERWVSMFLVGSRGFSHEQVRHDWRVATSQRSTRFVDEDGTDWVRHPLINVFQDEMNRRADMGDAQADDAAATSGLVESCIKSVEHEGRDAYKTLVKELEPWLVARGVDKGTARKQARGAARGYLGNALETQLVFSASVAQWKEMLRQRLSPGADAEIRAVYAEVLGELRSSRYADRFTEYRTVPSPDGIGVVLAR